MSKLDETYNRPYPHLCGVIWVRGGKNGDFKIRTIQDLHDYIEAVTGLPPARLGTSMYDRRVGMGAKVAPHTAHDDCLCGLDIEKVCVGYGLKPPARQKHKGKYPSLGGYDHHNFIIRFDEDESGKKPASRFHHSAKGLHYLPLPRRLQLHEDFQDNLLRSPVALQRQGSSRKARGVLQIPSDEARGLRKAIRRATR